MVLMALAAGTSYLRVPTVSTSDHLNTAMVVASKITGAEFSTTNVLRCSFKCTPTQFNPIHSLVLLDTGWNKLTPDLQRHWAAESSFVNALHKVFELKGSGGYKPSYLL